jgi:hypothetical protein
MERQTTAPDIDQIPVRLQKVLVTIAHIRLIHSRRIFALVIKKLRGSLLIKVRKSNLVAKLSRKGSPSSESEELIFMAFPLMLKVCQSVCKLNATTDPHTLY